MAALYKMASRPVQPEEANTRQSWLTAPTILGDVIPDILLCLLKYGCLFFMHIGLRVFWLGMVCALAVDKLGEFN